MHIVLCSTDYPPLVGGIARYSYHIAKNLAKEDIVKVLAVRMPHSNEFDRLQEFVTVRVPNVPIIREALLLRALLKIHRAEPIDWIINAVWFPCGLLSYCSHRIAGIKYVIAAHGSEILDDQRTWKRTLKGLFKAWKARMMARASVVFPGSQYTKGRLLEAGVSTPMIVLNYGVDPEVFCPGPPSPLLMRQLEIGPAECVLLSVGRLDLHKGHDVVIQALPRILKKIPSLVYIIVGDGPERKRLEQLVRHLGVASKLRMVGSVDDEHLAEYYRLCDIFILPNREIQGRLDLIEGFGIVFLEAGACEKPVIGGRSGGVSDAVLHGQTGLLVDPLSVEEVSDAVVRLCKNQAYAQELGQNGRKRCQRELNWVAVAGRLHKALEQLQTARR